MCKKIVVFLICMFVCTLSSAQRIYAQEDLTKRSLEDLMNIDVYTASKKPERFFDTAASIYVITPEDIRRSGAGNIPELLRMVPGLSVQQVNAHSWDISARGFNGSIMANKLLVIIDGRAVYSPLLGGVFWELQDTVLEDIERIEVIRGPGGTAWGANAVNGVINIITKKAKDTQGGLISVGGGTELRDFSTFRYGSKAKDWYYRVYGKYFDRDESYRSSVTLPANDEWQMARTGFRAEKDQVTLEGDFYQGYLGQRVNLTSFNSPYNTRYDKPQEAQGANFSARYEDESRSVQAYWQETDTNFQTIRELRHMLDMEYNEHTDISVNQELNWGAGYRLNLEDTTSPDSTIIIDSPSQPDQLFSVFLQDAIKLTDQLKLTIGSKVEYNIYTKFEVEPNVRLAYDIDDHNMVWAAASRAIRTPSRLDEDGHTISGVSAPAIFTGIEGNHDLSSEKMRSFEVGYRTQPNEKFFFDLSAFADHYDHLVTYIPGTLTTINGVPFQMYSTVNGLEAETYGIELAGDITLASWWKIKSSYTYTKMNVTPDSGIPDIGIENYLENAVPSHNAYVRSSFNLPYGYELDATLRYMDSFQHNAIPSSTELDIHLSKTFREWQVSLIGQNLLRSHHKESFAAVSNATTQVERGGYVKVTRKF